MNLHYLKGDATQPQAEGIKIIAHICNDVGGWGKGFVMAISKRWKAPETEYRNWYKNRFNSNFQLGEIQIIQVEKELYVANMIAQRSLKGKSNAIPIRYEAVEKCLKKLAVEAEYLNASIHMPRIGCGLAGGKWENIEPIIKNCLEPLNIETYVYDFE